MDEPPRLFTLESAQQLLDTVVRPLAERLVSLRARSRDLEHRWRQVVLAVASNGGNMRTPDVDELRARVERSHAELRELL
ncbi:MAG TPA: hypothetical protein VMU66_03215, partial [Gaiellales bacterium]|nr:hypothetical protein [Gaiellales bacterium]